MRRTFSASLPRFVSPPSLTIMCTCVVAQLGCGVAQLVVYCAVREAGVRFSARHPGEVFSTELASDKKMEGNLGE